MRVKPKPTGLSSRSPLISGGPCFSDSHLAVGVTIFVPKKIDETPGGIIALTKRIALGIVTAKAEQSFTLR